MHPLACQEFVEEVLSMKIGTLTLHLPFNYGNALQMFSLHKYLLEQGYDTEIISHWYRKDRDEIFYYHNSMRRSWKGVFRFLLACCCCTGAFNKFIHERKIKRWLDRNIKWSEVSGYDECFDADRLPHDVIIVGSDQVWNPKHRTSDFFLMPTFPARMTRIAYAASFGTDCFPEEKKAFYRTHLAAFKAISVRESSGKQIVESELNNNAMLVCDPTLLHTREEWCRLLGFKMLKKRDDLVMYFVTPDYCSKWKEAIRIARESGRRLHVFVFSWTPVGVVSIRHPFRLIQSALSMICRRMRLYISGVRLHFSATPAEFVKCIAECDGLITDSFHGMMFATIFGKKCNVTIGEHEERQQMSARLLNFTQDFGRPEILTPKADLLAMRELTITPKLQELVDASKRWLKEALNG